MTCRSMSCNKKKKREEYFNAISKVLDWCANRGINVVFKRIKKGEGGSYNRDHSTGKTIKVSSSLKPQTRLHVLLHECGHYIIDVTNPGKYPRGYANPIKDGRTERSWIHKIDVIAEEIEAWERGWELGVMLGIWADESAREDFDRTKTDYLKTYIKWACGVDGY